MEAVLCTWHSVFEITIRMGASAWSHEGQQRKARPVASRQCLHVCFPYEHGVNKHCLHCKATQDNLRSQSSRPVVREAVSLVGNDPCPIQHSIWHGFPCRNAVSPIRSFGQHYGVRSTIATSCHRYNFQVVLVRKTEIALPCFYKQTSRRQRLVSPGPMRFSHSIHAPPPSPRGRVAGLDSLSVVLRLPPARSIRTKYYFVRRQRNGQGACGGCSGSVYFPASVWGP
ncbi:hypothetical protein V8C37DRAFT_148480 [Trichoderma ceciliae]